MLTIFIMLIKVLRFQEGNAWHTLRNQKDVGFKPEFAANGANNARHFAWALHKG